MAETNELGGFIQSLAPGLNSRRLLAWSDCRPGRADEPRPKRLPGCEMKYSTSLEGAGSLDGVLFALHGALVADEHPDVEGEILESMRHRLGPDLPVVATYDLHAKSLNGMVRHTDALVGFHTAPHIDVVQTGQRGARRATTNSDRCVRPTTAFIKIPMVVPAEARIPRIRRA